MLTPVIVAGTNPIGGRVTAGSGTIDQIGNDTTIYQNSPTLRLDWRGFDVGAESTVRFLQPGSSSIAVNRILGSNGSVIMGRLDANGQVFLINPNGVLFGEGAQVNVGGLVASTLDMDDRDIGSGTLRFSGDGGGSIVNRGTITAAPGGYVALLGQRVSNQGTISTQFGSVALGGGSKITLRFDGNRLLAMQVDANTLDALADNRQLIVANGGQVLMSAGAKDSLLASVVNNSGVIQARTVESREGRIILLGGIAAGTAQVAGALDASAPDGGNGGFVETSAAHVHVSDGTLVTAFANHGHTGTWLIDPFDFTVAASGGDITGALLSASLASADVVLQSNSGGSGTAGNVNINDQVSWSANRLTLSAQNNVNINADLNGSGTAKLALEYGQASASGTGSGYTLSGARVNLVAGDNFSTRQGSSGATLTYTVVTSLGVAGDAGSTSLQGMGNNLTGRYALGADIDASATSGWNGGAGFNPIGTNSSRFTGGLDGLGHVISALTINRPATDYVGLFGYADSTSIIRNIGLINVDISGGSGVGGLVGANGTGGSISNAYVTGQVVGLDYAAGLAGRNLGSIGNSHTNVAVSGRVGAAGLVGRNGGNISDSHAIGQVVGSSNYTGGLVGINIAGTITNSYATGTVHSGNIAAGGLVAYNFSGSSITNSYATGAVSAVANDVGGLVGINDAVVTNSYATGAATGGNNDVGGLVGQNSGNITNSYATGAATGVAVYVGGLVGVQFGGAISRTYATGAVSGQNSANVGGLVGRQDAGTVADSYWNTQTTGQAASIGGGTGLTNAQMKNPASFAAWGTDISAVGGSAAAWRIYVGQTAPLLRAFMTNLVVADVASTYNGAAFAGGGNYSFGALTPSRWLPSTSVDSSLILGTVNASTPAINAGTYTLNSTLYSGQMGYDIDVAGATVTIRAAALTISTSNISKTYDGTLSAIGAAVVRSGTLFGGDTLSGGSFAFTDKNAGSGKTATIAGVTVSDGNNGNNYAITYAANTSSTITALPIAVGATGVNRVYDGTLSATALLAGSGVLTGDTIAFTGSASFADKNVGSAKAVTVSGIAASGADATNYSFNTTAGTTADITPLAITVGATGVNRAYDGTLGATALLAGSGVLAGDAIAFTGSARFADKNAGIAKPVTVTNITASGADTANYSFNTTAGTVADITARAITVGATGVNRVYDGTLGATALLAGSGVLAGDIISFAGNASFADKNAGTAKTVTVTGIAANGANAANYSFNTTAGTTADITPLAIIVGATGVNRVYDGTLGATALLAGTGVLAGDAISFTGSASFTDKNVGSAKTVAVTGIAASGGDAANYRVNTTAGTTADITPARLTYVADSADLWLGQPPSGLSGTVLGLVGGETLADATTGILSWTTAGKAGSGPGQYAIEGGGLAARNYVFVQAAGNAGALTVRNIKVPYALAAAVASLQSLAVAERDADRSAIPVPDLRITEGGVRLP